jgi:hypothetical protein
MAAAMCPCSRSAAESYALEAAIGSELMGAGLHPELADCRRVRFDISTQKGKPRFRLIYRNEPADGAPAECH